MSGRHGHIWPLASPSAQKNCGPCSPALFFLIFLYAVVHMVPQQLFRGSFAVGACRRPTVPGVMMDSRHDQEEYFAT